MYLLTVLQDRRLRLRSAEPSFLPDLGGDPTLGCFQAMFGTLWNFLVEVNQSGVCLCHCHPLLPMCVTPSYKDTSDFGSISYLIPL